MLPNEQVPREEIPHPGEGSVVPSGDMADLLGPTTLVDGLRTAMDRANLTIDDLADGVGMSHTGIANFLRKQDARLPRADVLRAITRVLAEAMGAEPDQLWLEFGRLLDATPSPVPPEAVRARVKARTRRT